MQERRSWDKRQGRGDKGNLINGLPECVFNNSLGSILERILTNDNKIVSHFSDMSGNICVWFLWLVSDFIVFFGDRLVFGADLVVENLEVDLVSLQSEAVNYVVVGCNTVLVILGI